MVIREDAGSLTFPAAGDKETGMRIRLWISFCAIVLALTFTARPALAGDGSVTVPFHQDPATISDICAFPVYFEDLSTHLFMTTWPDTTVRISGPSRTRVTNTETGKTRTINTTATIWDRPNSDGSRTVTATGNSLFFFQTGDLGAGRAGVLWWIRGRFVETITIDNTGKFHLISYSSRGKVTDMCKALGSGRGHDDGGDGDD